MEGGDGDLVGGVRAEQRGEAVAQLVAGTAGERDGQAALGRQARADPVRDRVREHPGLARAGAGHHEQRAARVGDDRVLLRVEAGRPPAAGGRPRAHAAGPSAAGGSAARRRAAGPRALRGTLGRSNSAAPASSSGSNSRIVPYTPS